jgi:phospholipase C
MGEHARTFVSAIQNSPEWASTATFTTYDDCGCFYDHVSPDTPHTGWGIRVPMVIVSPYARPGFTDSTPVSATQGVLAFIDHTFGLTPLGTESQSYDYSGAFDYSQQPLPPVQMTQHQVPQSSLRQIAATPTTLDPT